MTFTDEEVYALHWFAKEHGRCWKVQLRDEWMRACGRMPLEDAHGREIRAPLQRLRNNPEFGCRGLEKFRLPKGFSFKEK